MFAKILFALAALAVNFVPAQSEKFWTNYTIDSEFKCMPQVFRLVQFFLSFQSREIFPNASTE
jgi:hypothetical protein